MHLITKLWNWLIALMKPYHRCAGVIHPTCWLTTELMNRHISSSYIYSSTWTTQCTVRISRASPCQFIKSYLHQTQPSAHCMLFAFLGAHCALLSRDHPRRASIREPSVITQQKHLVLFFLRCRKIWKNMIVQERRMPHIPGRRGATEHKVLSKQTPIIDTCRTGSLRCHGDSRHTAKGNSRAFLRNTSSWASTLPHHWHQGVIRVIFRATLNVSSRNKHVEQLGHKVGPTQLNWWGGKFIGIYIKTYAEESSIKQSSVLSLFVFLRVTLSYAELRNNRSFIFSWLERRSGQSTGQKKGQTYEGRTNHITTGDCHRKRSRKGKMRKNDTFSTTSGVINRNKFPLCDGRQIFPVTN